MPDPAGKSLYLQAWWYREWSGLGPNAPIPLPIIPAFQDASGNNALPSPQPWHWERGMSPVCGHPHQDRQRLCPPSAHWQPAHGQLLPTVTRPLLHFRSRSEFCTLCSVQAELLVCEMLLPHAGNWVSSWRAVCLCRVTRFLSRREMLNFCTSVCRIRTLSD